jgi:uncharacterized membrane protein YfcA
LLALKKFFALSFRKGALAFLLWQILSTALGTLFLSTDLAAIFLPLIAIPIVALAFLFWWLWRRKSGIGDKVVPSLGQGRTVATLLIVVLLCSSLLTPSIVCFVQCEPEQDSTEQEVEVDFTWDGKPVTASIAWNASQANAAGLSRTSSEEHANPALDFVLGLGEGALGTLWGIINVPGALWSSHDFHRDMTYTSLISDITNIQNIIESPQQQDRPRDSLYNTTDTRPITTIYAKDLALANKLASMDRKEFKLHVAENPQDVSRAVDTERYVETVSWGKSVLNFVTLNIPLTIETYQRVVAETGKWTTALYEAGKVFSLTSPLVECYEAAMSGDARRFGRSIAQAAATYGSLYLAIKALRNVGKVKGYAEAAAKTLYNYTVGNFLDPYYFFKNLFSGAKTIAAEIEDERFREYFSSMFDDLIEDQEQYNNFKQDL